MRRFLKELAVWAEALKELAFCDWALRELASFGESLQKLNFCDESLNELAFSD